MRKVFCLLISCMLVLFSREQMPSDPGYRPFVIQDIIITGNKKTKAYIIERELPFRRGDSVDLAQLVRQFEKAKQLLINTALFHEAIISLKKFEGYKVYVAVDVKERWYLFPIPYFKPVDRNLSEWARQGYGLDRVNYGIKFTYNNFTGRNDKLKAWLITGYTRRAQFQYELPFVDKFLQKGFKVNVSYEQNREINFASIQGKQAFLKDTLNNKMLQSQFNTGVEFTYRPYIRTKNTFRAGFGHLWVDTAVINKNPNYISSTDTRFTFPEISYKLEYFDVDYIPYPQQGTTGEINILKRGFSKKMNVLQLYARANQSMYTGEKTSYSFQGTGIIRFPYDQPYIGQRMFGYGDLYLRGLEKYVVDGIASLLFRNTLRRQILSFDLPSPSPQKLSRIPFRVFVKSYFDVGYVKNVSDLSGYLVNRMLYTGGLGADVVTFYDMVLRFEYSFNQMGEHGFFFHIKNDF